jgi:hypothetical protein
MWAHYKVVPFEEPHTISSPPIEINKLKELFNETTEMELNWLFLGTSGIHSWYGTLDQCEEDLKHIGEKDEDGEIITGTTITLLIVHPRVCCIQYGELIIRAQEDIDFLRKYVTKTIKCLTESSQYENLDKKYREKFEYKEPERGWI